MNFVAPQKPVEPVLQTIQRWVDHAIPMPDWAMAQAEGDPSCLYYVARRIGFWAATATTRISGPLGPLTAQRERMMRADELARHLCVAMDIRLRTIEAKVNEPG